MAWDAPPGASVCRRADRGIEAWPIFTAVTPQVALAGLPFLTALIAAALAIGSATLQDISPSDLRGRQHGLAILLINILGHGLGPLIVGIASDAAGDDGAFGRVLGFAMPLTLAAAPRSPRWVRGCRAAVPWRWFRRRRRVAHRQQRSAQGWCTARRVGEVSPDTVMLYAPRDAAEVAVLAELVEASWANAQGLIASAGG